MSCIHHDGRPEERGRGARRDVREGGGKRGEEREVVYEKQ